MIKYVLLVLVLLLVAGCANQVDKAQDQVQQQVTEQESTVEGIEEGLGDVDGLMEDLDGSELDGLEAELDDLGLE